MKDKIIELIKENGPLSYGDILAYFKCENSELAFIIGQMENEVIYKEGKFYHLFDDVIVKGTIIIRNDNPFLKTDTEVLFINKRSLNNVFDKDVVIAKVVRDNYGRKEAVVTKIISHTNTSLVAIMEKRVYRGEACFKVVDPNSNYETLYVDKKYLNGATPKDICILSIRYKENKMTAYVDKIIGHDQMIGADVLALVAASKVPYEFSKEVYEEVNKLPYEVDGSELEGREDFTNDLVITIDGDDSKDFDDAVNVKMLANGNYLLSVYIADVSHYVKEGSAIDKEALNRGTSIYLVDRVIPMLAEKLSNGICSLNEGVTRLVLAAIMEIDSNGNIVNSRISSGFIKSKYRMTYSNVNKIFSGNEKLIEKYKDLYPMLLNMKNLSSILRNVRYSRGSIDFDLKEMQIIVDEKGLVTNVVAVERGLAEMMIEDFMLAANETVAKTLNELHYPCCYRVHEEPSKERLHNVNNILGQSGFKLNGIDRGVKPKDIQKLMESVNDLGLSDAINTMLLRAMAKARYDSASLGHYGLAAEFYCHFTSPIRRYPDLMVHRIINELIIKKDRVKEKINYINSYIDNVCDLSSNAERRAIELERMVNDMKAAEYMSDKVGEVFEATISSVTGFGLFVSLDNGIEGLVHVKNLPDFYVFDEKLGTLIGNYSKVVYNIGDRVNVRLIAADKNKRQIDFMLIAKKVAKGSFK